MDSHNPKLVGIVNITPDSFSDGGTFLDAGQAITHAKELLAGSADIIELSGVSSNPHSEIVAADIEIGRMAPVLAALDCPVSIDTSKPEVQRWALSRHASYINDIKGFPDASLYPELARADAKLVVMHSMSGIDKADRRARTTQEVFDSIYAFFDERLAALAQAGVARERLIIDPGMGFFLSSTPEPSFAVLRAIPELKRRFGLPLLISVSRKSFLRNGAAPDAPETAARTLEWELFSVRQGADYIRTHDVRALSQALAVRNLE